jgi:hypothetical protein
MHEASIPPLNNETRIAVDTRTAAYHLNRAPKTLRSWSSSGKGPLAPLRINGRLAWSVAGIREVMGCGCGK